MIKRNSNRKLTLEQRIAHLENALRRNLRRKFESFESDLNEAGARAEAERMSKEFTQSNGIRLKLDKQFDTIYSMGYGWTNDPDVFNDKDDEAYFMFKYDVVGNKDISVYICPSENGICVWSSLGDDSQCEGAVNPFNGKCSWKDDLLDAICVPKAWNNFKLNMIHQDEDDEEYMGNDEDGDEDSEGDYNSYDICREILDYYDASDWIGESDIDEYLNDNYPDMSDDDRWFVHDRMEKFANVDPYKSVQDGDDEDFESLKRSTMKRAKIESRKQLQRRNRFHR